MTIRNPIDILTHFAFVAAIALIISSCAAPDTQHHIVISTREQKLATTHPLAPCSRIDGALAKSSCQIRPVAILSLHAFSGCVDASRKTPTPLLGTSTFTAHRRNGTLACL